MRDAPTPAYISTKSEPLEKRNGTFASPAIDRASSVLPVPGGPTSRTPFGMRPPIADEPFRLAQEVDDLLDLLLGLVDAGDVGEGHRSRFADRLRASCVSSAGIRPDVTRYSVNAQHADERQPEKQRRIAVGGGLGSSAHFDADSLSRELRNERGVADETGWRGRGNRPAVGHSHLERVAADDEARDGAPLDVAEQLGKDDPLRAARVARGEQSDADRQRDDDGHRDPDNPRPEPLARHHVKHSV